MTNKVFVGNLPWSIRTAELSAFLTDLGFAYRSVKVIEDRDTGRSRGFAFVEFETPQAATEAIAELAGTVCEGRTLFANEAKDNKPNGGGGGGGGGRPRENSRAPERTYQPDQQNHRREKSNKPRRGRDEGSAW
jgi:cold-inducible RNA-binding protein